jgi:hypothetical protein
MARPSVRRCSTPQATPRTRSPTLIRRHRHLGVHWRLYRTDAQAQTARPISPAFAHCGQSAEVIAPPRGRGVLHDYLIALAITVTATSTRSSADSATRSTSAMPQPVRLTCPSCGRQNLPEPFVKAIHRIHTGLNLTTDFTATAAATPATTTRSISGRSAHCDACHVSNGEQLPEPATVAGERTARLVLCRLLNRTGWR